MGRRVLAVRRRRCSLVLERWIVRIEQEGMRSAELADEGGVGDQSRLGLPEMQVITGRFHGEGGVIVRLEVEHDLVCDRGRYAADRAGPADLDRAMMMAAGDALDVGPPLQ